MNKRNIGRSDIKIAPIVFGGNVFGWTADEVRSFELLDAFVANGFNCIDTADVYSAWKPGNQGGESETIIGKWMKARGNRDNVVIATKFGMELSPDKKGTSKKYIVKAVEDSLRRLQTDYIDLYQSHTDDKANPIEDTLEGMDGLVKAGKVRIIGASNFEADRLSESLKTSERKNLARYQCLQPQYNLYDRAGYENELETVCREQGLGVITYFSLAAGFLSGKYRSEKDLAQSPRGQKAKNYLNPRGHRILGALDIIAKEYNSTPTQVSLAWLMARPSVTAPIVSATNLEQLKDLMKSVELKLKPEHLEDLNDASAE
jgi:aryl-alcohol dehydrogenase-like predicted oxidoreductase